MKTFLFIVLVLEAIFGIGFIFVPDKILGPMGIILDTSSAAFARLFGSAIISFPFLLYFVRKSDSLDFNKGVAVTMLVYFSISSILLLKTQLAGQMNSLGWSVVGLHIVFAVCFLYYLVKK